MPTNQNDVFFRVVPPQTSELDRRLKGLTDSLRSLRTQLSGLQKADTIDDALGRPQDIELVQKQVASITGEIQSIQKLLGGLPAGFQEAGRKAAGAMRDMANASDKVQTNLGGLPERLVPTANALPMTRRQVTIDDELDSGDLPSARGSGANSIWDALKNSALPSDKDVLALVELLKKVNQETKVELPSEEIQAAISKIGETNDSSGQTLKNLAQKTQADIDGRMGLLKQLYELIPQVGSKESYDALTTMASNLEQSIDVLQRENEKLQDMMLGDLPEELGEVGKALRRNGGAGDERVLSLLKLMKSSESGSLPMAEVQRAIEEITKIDDESGTSLRQLADKSREEIENRVALLEQLYQLIPKTTSQASYDALVQMATNLERSIDTLKDEQANLEARVLEETPGSLDELTQSLNKATTAQERLKIQAELYQRDIRETVGLLVSQERALQGVTDDKQIANLKAGIDQTQEKLTRLQKAQADFIEDNQQLPGADAVFNSRDIDMRTAIDYSKQMTLSREELIQREQDLRVEIVKQRDLLRESRKVLEDANDPRIIEGMTEAQRKLSEKIEGNVELLNRLEEARRFGGEGQADLSGYSDTLNNISGMIERKTEKYGKLSDGGVGAQLSEVFEQIAGLTENASKWRGQLKDLRANMLESQVRTSAWADSIAEKSPMLSKATKKLSEGMGTVADKAGGLEVVMGRVTAIVAGLTLGFQVFDALTGKSTQAIEGRIDRLRAEIDATEQILSMQSVEQMDDRAEQIREEIAMREEEAAALRQAAVDNTSSFDQVRTILGHMAGDATIYGQTGDALQDVTAEIEKLNDELNLLSDEGLRASVEAARENLEAEQRLQRAETDMYQLLSGLATSAEEYEQNVRDLDTQYDDETLRERESRRDEDLSALQSHLGELRKSEDDYQKDVLKAREEHLQSLQEAELDFFRERDRKFADFEKQWAKNEAKLSEELAGMQTDYQEERAEKFEDHNKELIKSEEEYAKRRLEHLEDLQDSLQEAEFENDVVAFMQAKRQGEKELKRMEEERAEELTENAKQFQEQLTLDRENHEESMAERRAQHAEERAEDHKQMMEEMAEAQAAHQENIARIKKEFAERQQAEADAHLESLNDLVESFNERRAEEQANRLREDMERQSRREEERQRLTDQYRDELEKAQKQQDDLLAVIESGGQLILETEDWTTQQRVEALLNTHRDFMAEMGYILTDEGLTRDSELADQRRRAAELTNLVGNETVDQLASYAAQRGQTIQAAYDEMMAKDDAQRTAFMANWQAYFYGQDDALARQLAIQADQAAQHWTEVQNDTTTGYETLEELQTAHWQASRDYLNEHFAGVEGLTADRYAEQEADGAEHETSMLDAQTVGHDEQLASEVDHQAALVEAQQEGMAAREALDQDTQSHLNELNYAYVAYYAALEEQLLLHKEIMVEHWRTNYEALIAQFQTFSSESIAHWDSHYATFEALDEEYRERAYGFIEEAEGRKLNIFERSASQQVTRVASTQQQIVRLYDQAGLAIVGGMNSVVGNLRSMMASIPTGIGSGAFGSSFSTVSRSSNSFLSNSFLSRARPMAFAEGGVIDRPTLALMGERGTELVMPFQPSKGLPENLGGPKVEVKFGDINIGSGMSRTEVIQHLNAMQDAIVEAVQEQVG